MGVIVDASIAQEIIRQAEKALAPELMKKQAQSAEAGEPRS
jgi:hypothetical protein